MTLNDLIWKVKSAVLARGGAESEDFDHTVAIHADEAIRESVRRCAPVETLRPYTLSDPDDVDAPATITLDENGVADLSTLTDEDPRILLDLLKYGEITHEDAATYPYPLRLLEQAGLPGSLDSTFPKCWLKGKKLHTRAGAETTLSDDLNFRVPHWMTLADFPAELVEVARVGLVDVLIEMAGLVPKKEERPRRSKEG